MKLIFTLLLSFLLCGVAHEGHATKAIPPRAKGPRVFTADGEALYKLRKRIRKHPQEFSTSLALLRKEATKYLDMGPWTITTKTLLPPSGDPHDYESQGPYW